MKLFVPLMIIMMALFCSKAKSQNFYRYRFEAPWSIAFSTGPTQYFGELYDLWRYKEGIQPDINFAFTTRYTFGTHLKARLDATYYRISGNDQLADPKSGRIPRNLNFEAGNYEGAFSIEYYWKPVKVINHGRSFWNPYIFMGIGLSSNNPYANYNGNRIPLRPLRTENQSYAGYIFTWPMGAGIKYKFNTHLDILLEINYRFTNTDYLDDVSAFDISGFYEALIHDYQGYNIVVNGTTTFYSNPNRLRMAVRNTDYLLDNGEPNLDAIIESNGLIRRGSGLDVRKDGFMTFNVGLEIYFVHLLKEKLIIINRSTR
ncbi:DUF6089 family protein [Anditalea andensis]|uniref:Uncharacterized protein n=1 Tax=Anditalea andensis TaxID=1048983 RepID=A0A074L4U8_9BACT|nr:DUF6089 family protein [Anditalea andensis]KEO74878.1 hypothetical protein EL17_04150 [Anditalea andensis]